MIKYSLLYRYYEFETSLGFLEDFLNNEMAEIGGAYSAGFLSDSNICNGFGLLIQGLSSNNSFINTLVYIASFQK